MEEQPPIELNYSGETPKKVDPSLDSRLLRVKLPRGYKAKRGTLKLQSAPGNTEGLPLRIRAGTEDYRETEVIFRAELDLEAILKIWHTVDIAALPKEHRVLITVETDPPPKRVPQTAKCRTVATINLNSIRWKWWPLEHDEKGGEIEGTPSENTPIELDVDGTDRHGFRLEVWREKKVGKGYVRQESDFTHYLAPEEPRVTFKILKPKPVPNEIREGEDQREIKTTWWAEKLDDEAFLHQLPIDTTIRVRAWQANSIRKHRLNQRPLTDPEDAAQLAVREIPLVLGLNNWLIRVVRINGEALAYDSDGTLNTPPLMLDDLVSSGKPWETGFEVEAEIYSEREPGEKRPLVNKEVDWTLLPSSIDNSQSGSVASGSETKACKGTWKTNEKGEVKFTFRPEKEHSIFMWPEAGGKEVPRRNRPCFCDFEITLKSADGRKPGKKIRPASSPDDEKAPSFFIDWAPCFDVKVFKLPFFIRPDQPLKVEPEGDLTEEKAEGIELKLEQEQAKDYRGAFRSGGTLSLIVTVLEKDKVDVSATMEDYSMILGEKLRDSSESRQVVHSHAPSGADTSTSGTPALRIDLNPQTPMQPVKSKALSVEIPRKPASAGPVISKVIALMPKVDLHPKVHELLMKVRDECSSLEKNTASAPNSAALKSAANMSEPGSSFEKLGIDYIGIVVNYLAEQPQKEAISKGKDTLAYLELTPSFVKDTSASWETLGDSVGLHREAYKMWESVMTSFIFDVLMNDDFMGFTMTSAQRVRPSFHSHHTDEWRSSPFIKSLEESKSKYNEWRLKNCDKVLGVKDVLKRGTEKFQVPLFKQWVRSSFLKPLQDLRQDVQNKLSIYRAQVRSLTAGDSHAARLFQQMMARFQSASQSFGTHADAYLIFKQQITTAIEQGRAQKLGREEMEAILRPLMAQRDAARQGMKAAFEDLEAFYGTRVNVDLTGGANLDEIFSSHFKDQCNLQRAKTLAAAFEDADTKMTSRINDLDTLCSDATTEIKERQIVAIKNPLEEASQKLEDAMTAARTEGRQYMDARLGEHVAANNAVRQRLRQLRDPGGGAVAPGDIPDGAFQSSLDQLEGMIISQESTIANVSRNSKDLLDERLKFAFTLWETQKKLCDSYLAGGAKKGMLPGTEALRETLKGDPPPANPEPSHAPWWWKEIGSLLSSLWDGIKWVGNSLDNMIGNYPSWGLGGLAWWLGWMFWIAGQLIKFFILYPLNIIFRIISRIFAKIIEAMTNMLLNHMIGRNGWIASSALRATALERGVGAYEKAGGAQDYFDLPHWNGREKNTIDFIKEAGNQFWASSPTDDMSAIAQNYDAQVDAFIATTLQTGYEDYYPGQLKQARRLYHSLCFLVMSKDTLENFKTDGKAGKRSNLVSEAERKTAAAIKDLLQALKLQPTFAKIGFFEPLFRLSEESWWEARYWDTIANWIGWLFVWGLRLLALLVALLSPLSGGATLLISTGLLLSSSVASGVVAVLRMLFSLFCFYPYATAYPRDVVALHGLRYATTFVPESERFDVTSENEIIKT